ncbi:MAG: glycosyltransferase [Longimicrobiales bacterium]
MRVAVVHDWLTGMRGGERVLEALLGLFDDVEIFTLLHVPGSVSPKIEAHAIHTSFLDRLPFREQRYRHLLPAFPAAIERFDLRGFDLIVSSSHCVAKGAIAPAGVPHLCYCHTPMRYVWDQYDNYFAPGRASPAVRLGMRFAAGRLRRWDTETANRPTVVLANSSHVRDRVNRYWRRDAAVVYPPVDVDRFRPSRREDFYLAVSALVPYKRLDIAVEAFAQSGRRLIVVGDGPEYDRLARLNGRCTEFTGRLGDHDVADLMGRCRAFVLPGEEDFGIAAVEAQAAGAPVIALGRGGALETVVGARLETPPFPTLGAGIDAGPPTGIFFDEPTPASLLAAVNVFESLSFDPAALRVNAHRFHPDRFLREMSVWLETLHPA